LPADTTEKLFAAAFPYADDVLALPVKDLDSTVEFYGRVFGLTEVERRDAPPTVIMERDGVQIGFAINGGEASNEGAAILVTDIDRARTEVEAQGIDVGDLHIDERDGKRLRVFFVVAPDGLCFYFHQPIAEGNA
jgi:catechol 2,3-dioxygenase-like lactoylglutathione lyase family enzyme